MKLDVGDVHKYINEAPRSKLRGIKAKSWRSQPGFALTSFAMVRLAIHPYNKLQGILAKTNKGRSSAGNKVHGAKER